jgi:hypothetical protein
MEEDDCFPLSIALLGILEPQPVERRAVANSTPFELCLGIIVPPGAYALPVACADTPP